MDRKESIMKFNAVMAVLGIAAFSLEAADIGQVIVRQQWPWSTDVKVEYTLSNVTEPVDVKVRVFNGEMEADAAKVEAAVSGSRYALTDGNTYALTINPAGLFDTSAYALSDFKVKLSAVKAEASTEVLYKIVNLEAPYDVEDVTWGRLMNGSLGDVAMKFTDLDETFQAPVAGTLSRQEEIIWTGVTNDVKYKSTHMVLRKIPAKGKSFRFNNVCNVTFTNDFYIGVFEVTQAQFLKTCSHPHISTTDPLGFNETNKLYSAYRPANRVSFGKSDSNTLRGKTNGNLWPEGDHTTVDANSYFGKLQSRTKLVFDLPTEAMWEYACRGGSKNYEIYTGNYSSDAQAQKIMRASGINNSVAYSAPTSFNNVAPKDCDLSQGPAWVGSYLPNAYGLYDMLGNLWEICLDRIGTITADDKFDPRGPAESYNSNVQDRVVRGGAYGFSRSLTLCTRRESVSVSEPYRQVGFRVCLYPDFKVAE